MTFSLSAQLPRRGRETPGRSSVAHSGGADLPLLDGRSVTLAGGSPVVEHADNSWDAARDAVWGYVTKYHGVSTDSSMIANANWAKHFGASTDIDVATDRRHPFPSSGSNRYLLED